MINCCLLLYWASILLMRFVLTVFSSRSTYSHRASPFVCKMYALGYQKPTNYPPPFERPSSFLLDPLTWAALHLHVWKISRIKFYLLLSCLSLETSSFFRVFLPCSRRAGWIRKLRLQTSSMWSVQQSAPDMVFVTLPSCLSFLRTMT